MSDVSGNPEFKSGTGVRSDRGASTSTPQWVKTFGIIALVLVLLVILHIAGRSVGAHTASFSAVTEHGVQHP